MSYPEYSLLGVLLVDVFYSPSVLGNICACMRVISKWIVFRKWFQELLFITNCSIQHFSFVCTLLNAFKNTKWLNSSIWPVAQPLRVRVDMAQIAVKGYMALTKAQRLEFHNQIFKYHIRTLVGVLLSFEQDAIGVFGPTGFILKRQRVEFWNM